MKKGRKWVCAGIFAVICVLTINFLGRFTDVTSPLMGSIIWDTSDAVGADGTAHPIDINQSQESWELKEGDRLRLTVTLPEMGEVPGLYEDAYLLLESGTGETVILLDGEEYFRCNARDMGQDLNYQQLHVTLPPDAAGKKLTIFFTPYGGKYIFSPAYARFSSEEAENAFSAAYNNQAAIPAGAYSLGFVLVCAIFLVGLALGDPDWSLIMLALAVTFTMARVIVRTSGYYFLPVTYQILSSEKAVVVPTVLLVLYLVLNRKRSFWRYFGWVTLGMLLIVVGCYRYSRIVNSYFFLDVDAVLDNLRRGYLHDLLIWLNTYLLAVCGAIAAYGLFQNMVRTRSDAQALSLKNQLIMDNYHAIEQNITATAALRHDLSSQLTALHLMYEKGDMEGVGRRLEELDRKIDRLRLPVFSDNFIVNALLQNAAAQAAREDIRFRARAPLPKELGVDEGDLCSLLTNLLNNALEAAARVEDPRARTVSMSMSVNRGFLAICCENRYAGELQMDEKGWPVTSKTDKDGHGFGLLQMESIARRYDSKLEISFDKDMFTVQTALKMRRQRPAARPGDGGGRDAGQERG